jgi:uncharacterized protein (DUF736 family)
MDKKDIGAMWTRTSKAGVEYLTGSLQTAAGVLEIVMFKNDKGDNAKRPDWRIYLSAPRPELNPNGTEKVAPAESSDSEIPF